MRSVVSKSAAAWLAAMTFLATAGGIPAAAIAGSEPSPPPPDAQQASKPEDAKPVKPASQPPAPKAKPAAPKPGTAPAKKAEEPPLRFTNDDLRSYRAPVPAETVRPPRGTPARNASGKAGSGAPAFEDPLKPYKEKEAAEKLRASEIESLQAKVTSIQGRIDYLNQKRLAILDPLRIMPQAQSDGDRTNDAAMKSADLLAAVDGEIKAQETALLEAKAEAAERESRP
jgi:hypothetical protein